MCGDNLSVCGEFDPEVPQGPCPENEMATTRLSALAVMTTAQHNRGKPNEEDRISTWIIRGAGI